MNQDTKQDLKQVKKQDLKPDMKSGVLLESDGVRQPFKMKGSKFVVGFIAFGLLVSAVFCYAMYQSFLTRPKIKIEDEVKP